MIIKLKYSEETAQQLIGFTIAYMVSFLALLNCINAFLNNVGLNTPIDTLICYSLIIGAVIVTSYFIIKNYKVKIDTVILPAMLLLFYIVTYLLFSNNRAYMFTNILDVSGNGFYVLMLYSLPGYVFIRYLSTNKYLDKYLLVFSYIVIYMSAYVFFFADDSFANQYMTLSYNMLLQTVFLIEYKPEKLKGVHLFTIVLAIFIIASGGARGALLGLIVYFMISLFFKNKLNWKNIIIAMCVFITGCFFLLNYEMVIKSIIYILGLFNIKSRTFELLLYSSNFSSGRDYIYSKLIESFNLFGHGMYGDRIILNDFYAHNIFLELVIDFGVIIGFILAVTLLIMVCIGVFSCEYRFYRYIKVFIPTGLVMLILSSSYLLQVPSFYVLLGLCMNSLVEGKLKLR